MHFKKMFISTLLVFSIIVYLSGSTNAQGNMPQNEPEGFRGITWGTNYETLADSLVFARTDESYGGINIYTRKDDDLKIGEATLERIQYGFWQGKFSDVTIFVDGYNNWSAVHEALCSRFGSSGYKNNRYIDYYVWYGDKSSVTSEYNKTLNKGRFIFTSEVISKQREAWSKAKAKEGASNGF